MYGVAWGWSGKIIENLANKGIAAGIDSIGRGGGRLMILDFVCRSGHPGPGWVVVAIPCAVVAS
jgi:hypothetical protein